MLEYCVISSDESLEKMTLRISERVIDYYSIIRERHLLIYPRSVIRFVDCALKISPACERIKVEKF
jgi:hypothetical protein